MSVATTTAIAIAGGVAAAGGVADAAIGAHGAESAANTQAKGEQTAIDLQKQEWEQQQKNEQPFLNTGTEALNNLYALLKNPDTSKYPGGTFSAPTLEQAEQTPGFEFQLEQGTDAINKNAAATGNLLTGNTGKALTDYGQGLAQTDYNNLYQQALNTYLTNYGVWNTDTSNQVNRLQQLANLGANTAANLGTQGQAAATNEGNEAVGQATALASGEVGATNAITSGINGVTGAASNLPFYALLAQQSNQSSYSPVALSPQTTPGADQNGYLPVI